MIFISYEGPGSQEFEKYYPRRTSVFLAWPGVPVAAWQAVSVESHAVRGPCSRATGVRPCHHDLGLTCGCALCPLLPAVEELAGLPGKAPPGVSSTSPSPLVTRLSVPSMQMLRPYVLLLALVAIHLLVDNFLF